MICQQRISIVKLFCIKTFNNYTAFYPLSIYNYDKAQVLSLNLIHLVPIFAVFLRCFVAYSNHVSTPFVQLLCPCRIWIK